MNSDSDHEDLKSRLVDYSVAATRVPVSALFENLKDGATVEQFLEWFPGVEDGAVEAVLVHEIKSLADAEVP